MHGVFKCSCSPIGQLVLVTHEGKCLLRLGANRDTPWGNEWLLIDQPDAFSIREISIGNTQIWSLDEQELVYYRAGITENSPLGNKWVRISKEFKATSLTVSSSDQVWCVNSKDNQVYFRDGIDSENMSGIEWKKIRLKCKRAPKVFDQISHRSDTILRQLETSDDIMTSSQEINEKSLQQKEEELMPHFVDEDKDIYDDSLSFDSSKFENLIQTKALKSPKENRYSIARFVKENNIENVLKEFESNQIDSFIEEKRNELPSESKLIDSTFLPEEKEIQKEQNQNNDSNSLRETDSMILNEFNQIEEFSDVEFKFCDCNSFYLSSNVVPACWYDEMKDNTSYSDMATSDSGVSLENKLLKNIEWRLQILNELVKRNLKEHLNIDKISTPYINDLSWSRKDEFLLLDNRKQTFNCILEVIHTTKAGNERTNDFTACLVVKIVNKNGKILKTDRIDFKDIILITRWLSPLTSYPSFAIFRREQQIGADIKYVFLASSEIKLRDWVTQVSIFSSKLSKFTSLLSASTCVSMDGFAYYSYFESSKPILFSQIGKLINIRLVFRHFEK